MANKFLIEDLESANAPLLSNDFAVVERLSTTYKVGMQDIYRDVLSNRLAFKVGRTKKRGCPNVLSLLFVDDD